jgi:hypothetical protein
MMESHETFALRSMDGLVPWGRRCTMTSIVVETLRRNGRVRKSNILRPLWVILIGWEMPEGPGRRHLRPGLSHLWLTADIFVRVASH